MKKHKKTIAKIIILSFIASGLLFVAIDDPKLFFTIATAAFLIYTLNWCIKTLFLQ